MTPTEGYMAPRKKKAVEVTTPDKRDYQIGVVPGGVIAEGLIHHVHSNIKGGVITPVGACTAVVSASNRAGKTAVLDSVRFALTGEHAIGPHFADLCGLTADGSPPWAKVTGGGFIVAESSFPSGKKSVTHDDQLGITDDQRQHLLPLSSMRDLLTLGTAKAREELFRRFGGDGSTNAPAELDEDQALLWRQATSAGPGDATDRLVAASEWIRKEKRRLSSSVKSLEDEKSRLAASLNGAQVASDIDSTIATLQATLDSATTRATATNLLAKKEALSRDLSDAIDVFTGTEPPETEEVFNARPQVAERAAQVEALEQRLARLKADHATGLKALTTAQQILVLRKNLAGGCLVCESAEPSHQQQQELVAAMQAHVTALEQQLMPAKKEIDAAQAAFLDMRGVTTSENNIERRVWLQRVAEYDGQRKRIQNMAEEYKAVVAALEAIGVQAGEPVDEESLRDQLETLRRLRATSEQLAKVKASIKESARLQEDCKVVEGALADTLNKMLEGVKGRAQDAVNKWMPEGFRAVLQLEDTEGKPLCRWEVVGTDGKPHPRGGASGAEWAALTVALACAWTEGCEYRFLLLDDADLTGFSAANVQNFLRMIGKAVASGTLTQAFVAWSRPDEIPQEADDVWTILYV